MYEERFRKQVQMKKKKSLEAKLVKFAHRRRFQDYVREKGREKSTLAYVYWAMWHRSGPGNVFDLEERLFLGDLGIGKNALRPARKTLVDDGWLSKAAQKIDPLTGKWGTTAWTVNTEPVAHSEGVGTVASLTHDRSADVGSTGDRSVGDTVVLHSLYASNPEAYTSSVTLKGVTPTDQVSQLVSRNFEINGKTEAGTLELGSEENPTPQDEDPICVWSEGRGDYIGEEEVARELRDSFPLFKSTVTPTPEDMRLMAEIIIRADEYRVLASEAVKFAVKHKQNAPGLIPRTVKQLHKAVFEGDAMAGLLAQTKDHDPSKCGLCLKEIQALPCARCKASTYGKPAVEHGKPFCQDCMKLPSYRRHSAYSMGTGSV
jgi:hypothetical protein